MPVLKDDLVVLMPTMMNKGVLDLSKIPSIKKMKFYIH